MRRDYPGGDSGDKKEGGDCELHSVLVEGGKGW